MTSTRWGGMRRTGLVLAALVAVGSVLGLPPAGSGLGAIPARAATPASFTVVVFPDTQFYTRDYPATYQAQAQWVVSNRSALNVVFVAHEGDIVQGLGKRPHWDVATAAHAKLEAAGIPYSVLPGNHDMSQTGQAALYDTYFPPSRFAGKSWYLGYLGDSASGAKQGTGSDGVADGAVDRLNKDSYQVVTASDMRLVFISLEMDMPGYAVAWAQRVVDAQLAVNPSTTFVLVTHTFLLSNGNRATTPWWRADGTSAEKVWQTLVRPNCAIRFVLSGHYTAERMRSDNNACGQPVYQLLADYQSRTHGGDGWLRYLTFRPGDDAVDVRTYSPTLGGFETDANSQFSLAFPMPG